MLIAVLVIVGFVLLMLASGAYIFLFGCLRTREINWLDEKAVAKTPYAQFYSQIVSADRWLKAQGAQDIFTTSADGLRLHALWIPAENARGTIFLFHGYRSTYLVDFSPAFEIYHQAGFNILAPDQRSHGKSEGRFITFGVKESGDAQEWIAYHDRVFGKCPIILCGLSMGASTVLYLADAQLPPHVKGLIADCGFTSPKEILSEVYRKVTHLPPVFSMWATDLFARAFAGFSITEKDSRIALANSKLPVLMIHGVDDGFVPCKMSQDGYSCCKGSKQLLLVEGADHGLSFIVDRESYSRAVFAFIEENFA